jgi:hypothetical protein
MQCSPCLAQHRACCRSLVVLPVYDFTTRLDRGWTCSGRRMACSARRVLRSLRCVSLPSCRLSETNNYCVGENELLVHNRPPERAPKQGGGGKEGATNIPTWARGERPRGNEDGKAFAKRLCDERFGPGKYDTGTRSDFNQLKKYGDRHFVRPDRPKPGPKSGGDQKLEPQ